MELGYSVTIPTHVLLDADLTPLERLLYGVIVLHTTQIGHCSANPETLARNLRFKSEDKLKQIKTDSLEQMLLRLEELGHIKYVEINGIDIIIPIFQKADITVSIKEKKKVDNNPEIKDIATDVLAYLSKACISRGYKKNEFKPIKTNLELITARLNDGHSYDDCISVINTKFGDAFFCANPKYLTPHTLFRPTNFEKYLVEAHSSKQDLSKVTITKNGYKKEDVDKPQSNVEGVKF